MTKVAKIITSYWQDSANVLLGIWLIASPWALAYTAETAAAWNAWVVGAIIAVAAFSALVAFQAWEEWVNMALAAWLIVSPWVLGFSNVGAAFWNQIAVGIVVGALAIWSSVGEHEGGSLFKQT